MLIKHNGKIFIFEQENEIPKIYQDRLWFIVKKIDKCDMKKLITLSYVYVYNKHYNLEYEPHIMSELEVL